jgi:hypothetical protein
MASLNLNLSVSVSGGKAAASSGNYGEEWLTQVIVAEKSEAHGIQTKTR